jgi:thiol-disulfide isomerase/thioredoxin
VSTGVLSAQVLFKHSQDFDEMKAQARLTGKFIFIDAYTDWCGPCKMMNSKTFANDAVGRRMNELFVSYKLEMEQDSLGLLMGMKFAVGSYPTFLILTPEGHLHARLIGYVNEQKWLDQIEATLSLATPNRPGLSVELNLPWPDFYREAFGPGGKRKFPEAETVQSYLRQNPPHHEMSFQILSRFQFLLDSDLSESLLESRDTMQALFGADLVNDFIDNYLWNEISRNTKDHDEKALKATIGKMERYFPDKPDYKYYALLNFYLGNEDYQALEKLISDHFNRFNYSVINDVSWSVFENCEDQNVIRSAAGWMALVVNAEATYMYLDTYAALLYKAGQYNDAELWALRALETGKANNDNVKDTEKLLEKIRAVKN